MRVFFLTGLFLVFIHPIVFGQAPLPKGRSQFNAGVGLSGWGIPVYAGFDYGISKDITLGAEGSFRSYRGYHKSNRYHHTILGIGGHLNYHFNSILDIPKAWNFYAGLNLGLYIWNSPADYDGPRSTGVGLGLQVGGRYFINPRFGLNLELGGSTVASGGKFGITYLL